MWRKRNVAILLFIASSVTVLAIYGIERMRELANRSKCMNNLRQLGIAIQNYASGSDKLPPAGVSDSNLPGDQRLSWIIEIDPYIECHPMLPIDKTKPWFDEANHPYTVQVGVDKTGKGPLHDWCWGYRPLCMCPAHPNQGTPGTLSDSHFVALAGIGVDAASLPIDSPNIGAMGYDRMVRWENITKGTTNVVLVIETEIANGPWIAGGHPTVRGLEPDGVAYLGKN
jgi:hypothetical protein